MTSDRTFAEHVAYLQSEVGVAGISSNVAAKTLEGLEPAPTVLKQNRTQPEHAITSAEYFNRLVSTTRIDDGRTQLARNAVLLKRIEAKFGVPPAILVAVWGVESNFGKAAGADNVVRSLATLSHSDNRRAAFWKSELLAAMHILETGTIEPDQLVGSWAGAMGHTQFMPSTYLAHAVDFDGDGSADIWRSVPDALASTANYLRHSGWQPSKTWGMEVSLSPAFDFSKIDIMAAHTIDNWQSAGITSLSNEPLLSEALPTSEPCRLVIPAGARGPMFLVTPNFDAVLTYNRSTIYALSIGCLANRIEGADALHCDWPAETALSRAERVELQQHLNNAGLDTNGIDGIFGTGTRIAARSYQMRNGLVADGHPSAELLCFMRTKCTRSGEP